jgi:hypothetical protein
MVVFTILIIILAIVFILGIIIVLDEDGGGGFWLMILAFCFIFGIILFQDKTTKSDEPEIIPHSELSIMVDDDLAIIRYKDEIKKFYDVKQYKAIQDSTFQFIETKHYNILGDNISNEYEFKLK